MQSSTDVWRVVSTYTNDVTVDMARRSSSEYYAITTSPAMSVLNVTAGGRSYLRIESSADTAGLPESVRGSLNSWFALPEGRIYMQPTFAEFMKTFELDGTAVPSGARSWTLSGSTHGVQSVHSDEQNRVSEIAATTAKLVVSYEATSIPTVTESTPIAVEQAQTLLNDASNYQYNAKQKP